MLNIMLSALRAEALALRCELLCALARRHLRRANRLMDRWEAAMAAAQALAEDLERRRRGGDAP